MISTLQRFAVRFAAGVAIAFGAIIALAVAVFVAVSALALGIAAAIAGWFGLRSLKRQQTRRAGSESNRTEGVTVIDVEMREIDSSDTPASNRHDADRPSRHGRD